LKRSEINHAINNAVSFTKKLNFFLPPFAFWSPDEWKTKSAEYDEIREAGLGWDVTDFGRGDFSSCGFVAFTLRNGCLGSEKYKKTYAEKIIISKEGQITPCHFHWSKMEDIINRGGGNFMIQLYSATAEGGFSDAPVTASVDGRNYQVPSGTVLRLKPGESICLAPKVYHKFWAERGHGPVLLGEVSTLNDDNVDNRFYQQFPRFTEIEEDEKPIFTLCNEY
jgi:D-lyxose ketol-isomerase